MVPKPISLRLNHTQLDYVNLYAKIHELSVAEAVRAIIEYSREQAEQKAMRTPEFIHAMREKGSTWLEIAKTLGEPKTTVRSRYETALATGEIK